jgi:hypothetical protein
MTKEQRADLRTESAELRALVLAEVAAINARLDALERPKIARVVIDPPRTETGGGT